MSERGVLNYGGASTASMDHALDNFPSAATQSLSFCCTPIELLANNNTDQIICTATGFFWIEDDTPYLVTNWHVASGRNPFTGEVLLNTGFIPRRFAIYGHQIGKNGDLIEFRRPRYILELTDELAEFLSTPPSIDSCNVDVWAFPLMRGMVFTNDEPEQPGKPRPSFSCYINRGGFRSISTAAGDDCFILGYPLRNHEGLRLPVWKRGSIASETNIGIDGKPIFLVDAAVTSSMSGSPVIRKVILEATFDTHRNCISQRTACDLIGIYAGRLQHSDMERVNLGYAWYKSLISRVIRSHEWGAWQWIRTE